MKHGAGELGSLARADYAVKELQQGDSQRWDAFVHGCAEATFFHRAGWKKVIEDVFRHRCRFLYAERDGEIHGVLPLAQVKSHLFGHSLVSLPFCVYGGVAADEDEARVLLEAAAETEARRLGVDFLEYRNCASWHPDWPRQALYVRFRKELLPQLEDNMLAIPRKQRAMVRKGIKAGLGSVIDDDMDRFFDLYADNVHRHGTPAFPKRYFEGLKKTFGDDCETMVVVDTQGKPMSGVVSFYFRDEVLPYYAGDFASARDTAANDFKYWELMRRGCERGVRYFDYGRSKRGTGSFDFKKNWGFEPQPLHYEYRLYRRSDIPQNNPSNPKYKLFIALWQRMPRALVNRLGPLIVRNLG